MSNEIKLFHSDFELKANETISLKTFVINEEKELKFNPSNSTFFIFVEASKINISSKQVNAEINYNCYLSTSDSFELKIQNGKVLCIEIKNSLYPFNLGLVDYKEGKLQYIDGCSDSILISPLKKGLPCLNYLYFPKNTNQTKHYHPSLRFGIVCDGEGFCDNTHKLVPLKKGDFFLIPANAYHRFVTENSQMSVIAFHPDSDWGPQDENHPMINRTWF